MCVTERSSSAVCIDWFISVICRTTFADIFPSFSIRKVSCNLCRAKMRSDDKVICKEQIQLFRLYPCHLINLTYCFFCCTKFEVWCCGLTCRASYSKYFDRSVFQILCDLRDHFCRTYDCCCRTVTFPFNTFHTQEIPHLRIVRRSHVIHYIVKSFFFCNVFKFGSLQRQWIFCRITTVIDRHPV